MSLNFSFHDVSLTHGGGGFGTERQIDVSVAF